MVLKRLENLLNSQRDNFISFYKSPRKRVLFLHDLTQFAKQIVGGSAT